MAKTSRTTTTTTGTRAGLSIRRFFTRPEVDPYEEVDWELRDAVVRDWRTGEVSFEQRAVEFPTTWSLNATTIVAQKYFRGPLGTPEREHSVRQMIDRVADTITGWGRADGYFASDHDVEAFNAELKHLLVNQKAAFNSPVWFNVGVRDEPQCSACQPWDALVSTPDGLVPIGRLVETNAVGTKVYDAHGVTKIVATKHNGRKTVLRLHLRSGLRLDVTPDHLVWKVGGGFVEAGSLRPGDQLHWQRTEPSAGLGQIDDVSVAEAALAGWLQSDDGFLGHYDHGTNESLTVEALTVNDAERAWVLSAVDRALPGVHREERVVAAQDGGLDCRRNRMHGRGLEEFVSRWNLRPRGDDVQVPAQLFTAPLPVVAAYLRSLFQAEASVWSRPPSARIRMGVVFEGVVRGVQSLLLRFGIFSEVRFEQDQRADGHGCWSLSISNLCDRAAFHDAIGFVDERKTADLVASLTLTGDAERATKSLAIERIEVLTDTDVYDIQTESGEYLSSNLRVHNCFILSVEDTMTSILNWYVEEGMIFKGGSGSGVNLSRIRSSKEQLKGGGTASGPVSFMRGADASAGTIKSGGTTRRAAKMVVLNVDHPDIEEFIWCKSREEQKARILREAGFDMDIDGLDYGSIQYQNANNSVRVTDDFMRAVLEDREWELKAVTTGETLQTVRAKDLMRQIARAAWECADPGVQYDTTINEWHTLPNAGPITASNPCSEYLSVDNSACNLASLNLRRFEHDGVFDIDAFRHAVEVTILAQEIIVGNSSYPTERIRENTHAFRQLGLGYANLGGLLMSQGLAYDSDEGRAWAGAITALMTGHAYRTSAEIAKVTGPFPGFDANRDGVLRVLRKHRDALSGIDPRLAPANVLEAARQSWDDAVALGVEYGVRNSQATVLAPTGTISFLLDSDTTGIEPDLGLIKMKKLVGGGSMRIVNQTVPVALQKLGYQPEQIEAIVAYIDEHATIEDAPAFKPEHLPVFDCAMGERSILPMGHIKMMAAAQPFLSGSISKTCNVPETAAVEDIENIYIEGWKLGLKALAVYRDNCKVAQPLSIDKKAAPVPAPATEEAAQQHGIIRRRLPKQRPSQTIAFQVGDAEGYLTAGEYPGDGLGEIFVKLGKQGSTLSGVMDAFAISVSLGLQYGVPLEAYVKKFTNMRFEPAGMTDDPEVKFASSIVDYLFRRLAIEYLPVEKRQELGIYTIEERNALLDGTYPASPAPSAPAQPVADAEGQTVLPIERPVPVDDLYGDAPMCYTCGVKMQRAGSCHVCASCGTTSGCS